MEERTARLQRPPPASGRAPRREAYLLVLTGREAGELRRVTTPLLIGRDRESGLHLSDPTVSRRHARVLSISGGGVRLEDLGSTNGTFLRSRRISQVVLKDGDRIQIGRSVILKFTFTDRLEEQLHRGLVDAAVRDGLTGLTTKAYAMAWLKAEWAAAGRRTVSLAVVLLDIDYFKSLNDTYGHLAGDAVLRGLGKLLSTMVRLGDVAARFGGEEFLVVLKRASHREATDWAEHLRRVVADHPFRVERRVLRVTMSVGVAATSPADDAPIGSPRALVRLADRALYQAKRSGRNRVVLWPAGP